MKLEKSAFKSFASKEKCFRYMYNNFYLNSIIFLLGDGGGSGQFLEGFML